MYHTDIIYKEPEQQTLKEKAIEDAERSLDYIINTIGDNYYIIATNNNYWKYYSNPTKDSSYDFWYYDTFDNYYNSNHFNDAFWICDE
jgi:hypothetical protein